MSFTVTIRNKMIETTSNVSTNNTKIVHDMVRWMKSHDLSELSYVYDCKFAGMATTVTVKMAG